MKANKFFAVALAALTLVGFNACKQKEQPEALKLDPTSVTLKVGETATITANVAVTSWASNNEAVATVVPGNDGKSALITAVAAGNAIITSEKYASLIAGDFRPNDVDNNLYIWAAGETYAAGEGTGKNFFGNTEGYMALTVVAPQGWSGAGFNVANAESVAAAKELQAAIAANPDKFFLHIGIKATNAGNHQFYVFNNAEGRSFNIGTAAIEKGEVIGDFPRDGEWYEFNVPMAQFATAIAGEVIGNDLNILCFLSGATVGAQLNLDAVYFYEKN